MSWAGITVMWRRPGQSDDEALVELMGGSWDENDEFVPQVLPRPSAEQESARLRAVELLHRRGMREEPGPHPSFYDGCNEVVFYENSVSVFPARTSQATFSATWVLVQELAALGPSLVYETDDDEMIDLQLPVDEAREMYAWC